MPPLTSVSRNPSRKNCRWICAVVAPSALRTPISRVRSRTATSMMFITPRPPSAERDEADGHEEVLHRLDHRAEHDRLERGVPHRRARRGRPGRSLGRGRARRGCRVRAASRCPGSARSARRAPPDALAPPTASGATMIVRHRVGGVVGRRSGKSCGPSSEGDEHRSLSGPAVAAVLVLLADPADDRVRHAVEGDRAAHRRGRRTAARGVGADHATAAAPARQSDDADAAGRDSMSIVRISWYWRLDAVDLQRAAL